jgi:hypothetical protein
MDKLAIHGGTPVREKKIYYGHQYIDEADIQAVVDVLRSDYLTCGPKIKELEDKLCSITGAKYAAAVSNGTAALHVACLAAGIKPGDEVITTPYEDINLRTMVSMAETFDCVTGLSDHTIGSTVAGASVALGGKVIEKHLTLSRADGGVDSAFSMEPKEFKQMVSEIRIIEKALGTITYELGDKQKAEREHARSLFIAQDMKEGDVFTPENLRSVRPGFGLHTKYYEQLLGKKVSRDVSMGTPMSWFLVKE